MKSKKRANKENIVDEFRTAIRYIEESKKEIFSAALIFLIFIFLGFVFSSNLSFLNKYLAEIINNTKDLSGLSLFWFILKNNTFTSFISLFLGIIISIVPIFNTITNGLIIGHVARIVTDSAGFTQLWRLLPHGIFELPAVFISIGLGIKLGTFLFRKHPFKTLKEYSYKSLLVFILIVIPLLIIAALIESLLIALAN